MDYVDNLAHGGLAAPPSGPCARHPDRPAFAVCTRCGDFICSDCRSYAAGANELCTTCDEIAGLDRYYPVPVWRFVVFNWASFGLYTAYWAYRNWLNIKRDDQSDILPLARGVFFVVSYFGFVRDLNAQLAGRNRRLLSVAWPIGFVLFRIGDRVV